MTAAHREQSSTGHQHRMTAAFTAMVSTLQRASLVGCGLYPYQATRAVARFGQGGPTIWEVEFCTRVRQLVLISFRRYFVCGHSLEFCLFSD